MSRSSQRKGREAELKLAKLLRGFGFESVQAGEPVSYGSVPDLVGLPGIHVECKRAEQIRLTEWMKQAERDSERFHDGAPVVFHRRNREPWLVSMSLVDFIKVYDRALMGGFGRSDGGADEEKRPACSRGAADFMDAEKL